LEYLFTFSKAYLAQDLLKCVKFEQDHISKIKALRKKTQLKKENENFLKSCQNLSSKIKDLEHEKNVSQNKCDDSH